MRDPVIIGNATLYLGDCLEVLRTMPDCSVDSIVTDPPYGLGKEPDALAMLTDWLATGHHDVKGTGFMGKDWDAFVPQPALWRECLRVLKPGGHLLAFAGTRTHDLMTLGLRIAGFEIRDTIMWVYGSGFPKSLDVSKAIDKAAGVEREDKFEGAFERRAGPTGNKKCDACGKWLVSGSPCRCPRPQDEPQTDPARQWQGWGTALKPALEPITLARKPLGEKTVAANVLAHGTGALNIDGCRVEHVTVGDGNLALNPHLRSHINGGNGGNIIAHEPERRVVTPNQSGRWPANLIHDGSDEVLAGFPKSKDGVAGKRSGVAHVTLHGLGAREEAWGGYGGGGSAARFYYCAKASKKDRDEGLSHMPTVTADPYGQHRGRRMEGNDTRIDGKPPAVGKNNHPTVKPTALMRYLCRLVTPPGGTVLDPFMGSGSTGKAARLEGFAFIGIEREPKYFDIACRRIEDAQRQSRLFAMGSVSE